MSNKDSIITSISFLIAIALALYMYITTQKHSIAMVENKKLNEIVAKNYDDFKSESDSLKNELGLLKNHVLKMDSLYHNK